MSKSDFRYSNMASPDVWSIEGNLISLEVGYNSSNRAGWCRALVGNPANSRYASYPLYNRVSVVYHIPPALEATPANRHRVIFIGRVESAVQRRDDMYGEYLDIKCRDYSQEYADRYVGGEKAPSTLLTLGDYWITGIYPAGYTGQRREIISELASSYRYSFTVGPVYNITQFFIDANFAAGAVQAVNTDFRQSHRKVIDVMQCLADEEPWDDPPTGLGGDFWVIPHAPAGAGTVELPLDTATIEQHFFYYRRALHPSGAGGVSAQSLRLVWQDRTWTNRQRPLYLAELDPASGQDLLTRATIWGDGLDIGLWCNDPNLYPGLAKPYIVDTATENLWSGGGKQVKKEFVALFPEIGNIADAQEKARSFLKAYINQEASAGQGFKTGRVVFFDPPVFYWLSASYWTLAWPGFCIWVDYPPIGVASAYLVKSWVYREPECTTSMELVRLNAVNLASAISGAERMAVAGNWDSSTRMYDTGWQAITNPVGGEVYTINHELQAIPREILVYAATDVNGTNRVQSTGWHAEWNGAANDFYGHRKQDEDERHVHIFLSANGIAYSADAGRWIGWNPRGGMGDYYRIIVKP